MGIENVADIHGFSFMQWSERCMRGSETFRPCEWKI